MPANPILAQPSLPRLTLTLVNPHRASPSHRCLTCRAIPCLSLARPRLASRALPRSVSPTSPNQQRQASASTGVHALPARTGLAVPFKAMPATPSRLGRSDLTGPCLPVQPLAVPDTPSAPCLQGHGSRCNHGPHHPILRRSQTVQSPSPRWPCYPAAPRRCPPGDPRG